MTTSNHERRIIFRLLYYTLITLITFSVQIHSFCQPQSHLLTSKEKFSVESGQHQRQQQLDNKSRLSLIPSSSSTSYNHLDYIYRITRLKENSALMCQLLGMNCAMPTDFRFSFRGFSMRGGDTDIHSHGWGLAFYEGRGLRAFHDPSPCADSPIADFVKAYPVKTLNMMAHIRYATEGEVCLENVHPFQREMWGIQWCFAHNGDVEMFKGIKKYDEIPWIGDVPGDRIYNPVGDTDSEAIFCALLNSLKAKFETLPSLPVLHETISSLCNKIVQHDDGTILNFILGCGQHVQFAYSWPGSRPGSNVWNGLHYIVREPPFQRAHLSDCDYTVDFSSLTTKEDRVAVIATTPLTDDEEWIEFERGELIMFDEGLPHVEAEESFKAEIKGHGLESDVLPVSPSLDEDMRRYQRNRSYFVGGGI